MTDSNPPKALVIAGLLTIQVLFGINYVVTKIVVGAFPPLVWASIRIILCSIIMFAISAAFRRDRFPKDGRRFFVPMIVFSLLGSVINQGSFLVGLRHTTATNSAILNTLIPVFTLLIVTLRGQERLTPRRLIGFVLAFGGVLVIRKVEDLTLSAETALGDGLTILNCLSYALFLSYAKKFLETHDRVWTTTWLFAYGSVGLTLLALPDYANFTPPEITPALLASMTFAILGGTLATYFLNVWTLTYANSSSVSIFVYLQPIVASALAYFWFGELISVRTFAASLMIFGGVLLALRSPGAVPARAPVPTPTPIDPS